MFLAAAEERSELLADQLDQPALHAKWTGFPVSELSHHGQACCELAREWLRSMDYAMLNGGGLLSGPRWLRERYDWGPSRWPLYWCQAVQAETIDCGAHAALAHEIFEARGVSCLRAQLVQRYDSLAIEQWRRLWDQEQASDHWLANDCIYHEANAILIGNGQVKLWDGSACCWINPVQRTGYGSLLYLRIFAHPHWAGPDSLFSWGSLNLNVNEWISVGEMARAVPDERIPMTQTL